MTFSSLTRAAIATLFVTMSLAAAEPIKLHPDNPHYLLFRDKPTILITSGEHYGAVLNLDFDYIPYLDELQSKHLNLTRTFSGTYREVPGSFDITDNPLGPRRYQGPWARSATPGAWDGGNKFDLTKFDEAYFTRLKDFLTQAGKRGIVVEYVLFCTLYNDELWNANAMNARNNINGIGTMGRTEVFTLKHPDLLAIHDNFVRKVAEELNGFDNFYFEICNEPYFANVTAEWSDHIAATLAEAESKLPQRHLIAQNIANGNAKINQPNPHVSIFNFHYAGPPDAVQNNYALNKVISNDETGFRGKEDVLYRTEGWDFIVAGGAIFDNLDYSFTPGTPAGAKEYKSPGGGSAELRSQLRILKEFMEGFDFLRMKPHNEAIKGGAMNVPLSGGQARGSVRCLAEAGKAYAIYVRGGTRAELLIDLPAGNYNAEWVNTRTGQTEKAEMFEHSGGARKLSSPDYSEDVALRIKAAQR